jgi:hypothetical protein
MLQMQGGPDVVPRRWDIGHLNPWSQQTFPADVTRQEVIDQDQIDTFAQVTKLNS